MRTTCNDCGLGLNGYSVTYCRECVNFRNKAWRARKAEKRNRLNGYVLKTSREAAIAKYGQVCICCGESEHRFLTIDHIISGSEPKLTSVRLLKWLRKRHYPSGFQLLCYSCNCAKSSELECPHNELRRLRPYQI